MSEYNREFLTVREFAAKIGVHWFTVWRWTVENRITFRQIKAGGKILIPFSELSRLQHQTKPS
jgi:excisionase family DNA binding protein